MELLDFQCEEFIAGGQLAGVDARFEFSAQTGVARRIHWLQLKDRVVGHHLVLPDQPRWLVPGAPAPGPRLERLLAGASERRLVPAGSGGARIERLTLRVGEFLYVKYVSPAADWHMRDRRSWP